MIGGAVSSKIVCAVCPEMTGSEIGTASETKSGFAVGAGVIILSAVATALSTLVSGADDGFGVLTFLFVLLDGLSPKLISLAKSFPLATPYPSPATVPTVSIVIRSSKSDGWFCTDWFD